MKKIAIIMYHYRIIRTSKNSILVIILYKEIKQIEEKRVFYLALQIFRVNYSSCKSGNKSWRDSHSSTKLTVYLFYL